MHLDINNTFHKDFDPFRTILTFISFANVYITRYPTSPQQAWGFVGMSISWVKTKYNDLHYKQGDRITNITYWQNTIIYTINKVPESLT